MWAEYIIHRSEERKKSALIAKPRENSVGIASVRNTKPESNDCK